MFRNSLLSFSPSLLSLSSESGRKGGKNNEHLSANDVLTHTWRRYQQHLLQRNFLRVSVTIRCSFSDVVEQQAREKGRQNDENLTHSWRRRYQQHLLQRTFLSVSVTIRYSETHYFPSLMLLTSRSGSKEGRMMKILMKMMSQLTPGGEGTSKTYCKERFLV